MSNRKYILILILSITVLACKSNNNNDEKNTIENSEIISNDIQKSDSINIIDKSENLKLCKIYFYKANEGIVPEVSEAEVFKLFQNVSIKISTNEIILNGKKSSYKIDSMDSRKFFTRRYVYNVKVETYKKGFNVDLSKIATYLDLSVENNNVSPFKEYFMEAGDAIYINNTLFLNYKEYIISFVKENNTNNCILKNSSDNNISSKKIDLPFDYQKYLDLCYLNDDTICDKQFPYYKADELSSITSLINNKINKNIPNKIYCIQNAGVIFETYIFEIRDENEDYLQKFYLINIKNNEIIANQEIGQSIDGEAPEDFDENDKTFIVNKDLTISVFEKIYKKKSKLYKKYKISSNGLVEVVN